MHTYDAYGLGHALVDVQYSVTPELLAELGIEKGVMTLIDAERQAILAKALIQPPVESASGGSAANTMIGVAAFGGQACFAGLLGDDEWGAFYERDLRGAGVSCSPGYRGRGTTGQCLVMVTPDADRTMNTFLGVGSEISAEQLDETTIASSSYVYLEGYLLATDNGYAACCRARDLARGHGRRVSLTLSDPSIVRAFRPRFARLLDEGVDLVFCNADEARAFTGLEDRRAACAALARMSPWVCTTCGRDGALLADHGELTRVPGVPARAVDTTGAGDLFAGGVLFGVTHGHGLDAAARLGAYAAALVVQQYGPRLKRSLADEIAAILARAG